MTAAQGAAWLVEHELGGWWTGAGDFNSRAHDNERMWTRNPNKAHRHATRGDAETNIKALLDMEGLCFASEHVWIADRRPRGIRLLQGVRPVTPAILSVIIEREYVHGLPESQRAEHAFVLEPISVRVTPLFDGSGRRDLYPDGCIRTVAEAKLIAQRLADCWNERDQLRQQVAELAQALRETVALLRPESRGGLSDSRARAILAKHAGGAK